MSARRDEVAAPPPPVELKDMSPLEDEEDTGAVATAMRGASERPDVASAARPEDIAVRTATPSRRAQDLITPAKPAAAVTSPAGPAASSQRPQLTAEQAARLYAQQQAALKSVRGEFDFLAVPDWVILHPLLGAYLSEIIGTFAFVLTIALVQANSVVIKGQNDTNMTFMAIGMMLMCMVFTFGYISGGHFNPAITFAVVVARKIDLPRAVGYIICQCGAALGAGIVAMIIQGNNDIIVPNIGNDQQYLSGGLFSELIYTFALATVVLNVAYSVQKANFFYGFAIGMTVAAGAASVGRISGGAFNPAVATGLQVAVCLTGDCSAITSFWVYWLAPLVGAAIAAFFFSQIAQPIDHEGLTDDHV